MQKSQGWLNAQNAISLYIHIPFCRAKCTYCDFNSYPGLEPLFKKYVRALQAEARWVSRGRSVKVNTIYLGGGTPTVLPLALLGQVLDACREHFTVTEGAEVTVEANPGTVDGDYLAGLLEMKVNRLSLGVQSFHDDELHLLGRIHTSTQAVESYGLARQIGWNNINLDLIYGLPQQTLSRWQATLRRAIHLQPNHLSLYCLTVEEDTPLGHRIARGALPVPDPDLAAEMYILAEEMLDRAGYVHYEISNWAQPGYECRHNLTYWRNRPYLGLGAGAHSRWDRKRWYNVLSPLEYITRLETDRQGPSSPAVKEIEELDEALEIGETMILGLRLVQEGVRFADFKERFGQELMAVYGQEIREMEQVGLLTVDGERVRLTARGRLLGNEVFQQFLPEP